MIINNLKFFNKLFKIGNLNYFYFIYLVLLFVILSGIELISIAAIYPFIKLLITQDAVSFGYFDKFFQNIEKKDLILLMSLSLIVIFFLKNALSFLIRWRLAVFSWNSLVRLRKKLSTIYTNLPYEEFLHRGRNELLTNVKELTRVCIQALEGFLNLTSELLVISVIVFYLFYLNFFSTLVILLSFIFLIGLYYYFFKKRVVTYGDEHVAGENILTSSLNNIFAGLKEAKVLSKEDHFLNKVSFISEKISTVNIKNQLINNIPRHFLEIFFVSAAMLFICFSVIKGYAYTDIILTIGVYAVAAFRIFPSTSKIIVSINDMIFAKAATDRIFKDLIDGHSIASNPKKQSLTNKKDILSHIEFKDVDFKYKNADQLVIKNINLKIKSKELIGIIGSSGIGKSTFVDIILGFLKPTKGNFNFVSNSMQNMTGNFASYLPQEPILVNGTIEENITFENQSDNKINNKKVNEALNFSDLKKFVDTLKNGTKTLLGDKGINLSIGQKQRLALARCFYFDREVMILDEPTSSLDDETQDNIFNNIKHLKGKKTIIIVSHNLKTLKACDKVLRFENKTFSEIDINEKY